MKTILELQEAVKKFCVERDWDQFHKPKDLAIGVSTEANELLEIFRFKSDDEVIDMLKDHKLLEKIQDELADVLFFLLRFSQMNKINLEDSLMKKIAKNAVKYPVDKSKGSNKKYNE